MFLYLVGYREGSSLVGDRESYFYFVGDRGGASILRGIEEVPLF